MSLIIIPIAITFAAIHYLNGGEFGDLTNLMAIVFMIWMLDIIIKLSAISVSLRRK